MQGPGLILVFGLAMIHAFVSKLNVYAFIPERRWMSFAEGVSVGYVFLEIFPELSHSQQELEHSTIPLISYLLEFRQLTENSAWFRFGCF